MKVSIVIPHRKDSDCKITLDSLQKQTFTDFKVIMSPDTDGKGANWARNEGFKRVDTEFVLFSDDDINWHPDALQTLYDTLIDHPEASYSYGAFEVTLNGVPQLVEGNQEFSKELLLMKNYITTMSLIRTKDFLGFDENIKRFQDWDLWLHMLMVGMEGVYCHKILFSTEERMGITHTVPLEESVMAIKMKYRI